MGKRDWVTCVGFWCGGQHKSVEHCIPYKQYRKLGGFVSDGVTPGNWTYRIRAESLGGRGNWTSPRSFLVPENG